MSRAPLRFLAIVLGGWVAGRTAWLLPAAPTGPAAADALAVALPPLPGPVAAPPVGSGSAASVRHASPPPVLRRRPEPGAERAGTARPPAPEPGYSGAAFAADLAAEPPAAIGIDMTPLPPSTPSPPRRLTGYAYLYARARGGGAALGPGGQLGASQAGARIAWRVRPRVALAARLSSPLDRAAGAEGAVGIDLAAARGVRLSVERRIALGHAARDAWSAYAAGGVWRALGRGVELDLYAQAGVVGVSARDPFADGALRLARRVPLDARRALLLGAGAWGAAQPGAARLDIGPRAALTLPLGEARAVLALEGRLRIAGRARPASGAALTLAAEF